MDANQISNQFRNLPKGWETDPEIFKIALGYTFRCEAEGCDVEGSAEESINFTHKDGKNGRDSKMWAIKVTRFAEELDDRGRPKMGRDGVRTAREDVLLQVLCNRCKHLAQKAAAERSDMVVARPKAEKRRMKPGEALFRAFRLGQHLQYVSDEAYEAGRQTLVGAFFLALAKGEKTVADGMRLGYILPLPEGGAEITHDDSGKMPEALCIGSEIVGLVSADDGEDGYKLVRQENKDLFRSAGVYLDWSGSLALARDGITARAEAAKQYADRAKERETREVEEAERRKAAEAARAASAQGFANRFAALMGKGQQPTTPAPAAKNGGSGDERRRTPRTKREVSKPAARPGQEVPSEREQIAEGLAETEAARAAAHEAAEAKRAAEPEEPRGSEPPTHKATLGEIAGVNLLADATSAKTE